MQSIKSFGFLLLLWEFLFDAKVLGININKIYRSFRRRSNLSSLFGSERRTAEFVYERVASHPVFQVTTSWGAAYMNFERPEEAVGKKADSEDEQNIDITKDVLKPVALFYMDPEEAVAMHQEMSQMPNLKDADLRITATTLSRAIRQSSNFGGGLPTGQPIDFMTGKLPKMSDGGSLRYKIVPSLRQLYYAARCQGRERVGLYNDESKEAARSVLGGWSFLGGTSKAAKREVAREEEETYKGPGGLQQKKQPTTLKEKYAHMRGYVGIPVFYTPALRKRMPKIKSVLGGTEEANPIFFSYEDLVSAWKTVRRKNKSLPPTPPVEVFNLMDVLTSMDRVDAKKHKVKFDWKKPVDSAKEQFNILKDSFRSKKGDAPPGIESLTFIPPGNAVTFKERSCSRGNGKARIRSMR